jgi:DNA polymerase III delta prime subunit
MMATNRYAHRPTGDLPDASTADPARLSILDLVLMRVRTRAQRRAAWLVHLHDCPAEEHPELFDSAIQAAFDDRDNPDAEMRWLEEAEGVRQLNERLSRIEGALDGKGRAGLKQLADLFGLSRPELDLLQACLALAVDPGLGPVYGRLQRFPGRSCATETLAARLFGYGRQSLWNAGCPLAAWELVREGPAAPGEPSPLTVDPIVVDWLNGELRMDPVLEGVVRLVQPQEPMACWPVDEVAQRSRRGLERESSVRVLVAGPPSSGRRTFAAAVASKFGLKTLAVDTDGIADADWRDYFIRAQRLAILGGTALVWHGSGVGRAWPSTIVPAPIQFIACEVNEPVPPCPHGIDYSLTLTAPNVEERRRLWRMLLPESLVWPASGFEALVERYRLNPGDIVSVARRNPASVREAAAFARELTRHRLGELAQLIECPFTWSDLVVPDRLRESLEDFAFEARDRPTFWDQTSARRLFPRGTGLVALFSGPPGTGKTMAAQVIAADLELDLFRIDLASVVSKYIGETAKHLSRIFTRASRMNAVLLFDEADALFTKRTEVKDSHDRYANADTSYLLQLLEEYTGIVILASNKRQNIDPAFIRRVRYVFEFPRPDAAERRRIWRQVVGELSGLDMLRRLESTIEALALNVQISGAQIKNAVLASIFIARRSREPLAMPHLLRGVEREMSKEGRSMATNEKEKLIREA